MTNTERNRAQLREAGLKATTPRLVVLEVLARTKKPMGVPELQQALAKGDADTVTLYRILEDFSAAGIVRRVDLRHGHADYELVHAGPHGHHHHHIVCTSCGRIEDIDACAGKPLEAEALRASTHFKTIEDHSLEFFGVCAECRTS